MITPPPAWTLRPASPADVEPIAELRAVVLRPDLERLGRYDEQRVRQRLRDGFEPGHTQVIEAGGAFAGCVALRAADDGYWLEHFYLSPELQGVGVGSAVLARLLRRCDREHATVRLNVLRGSPARRLYTRHGFEVDTQDEVDVFMSRRPGGRGSCLAAGSGAPEGAREARDQPRRRDSRTASGA
ncbi:GNAT family N-acetyltransferase [Streptomyces sp. Da 82-17]|uniref:GNAT family N-acetyltransferase n=1 Tax=Streptomyces sp. Da 82-17 TaxID=3377116 RepID=UPI0038D37B89